MLRATFPPHNLEKMAPLFPPRPCVKALPGFETFIQWTSGARPPPSALMTRTKGYYFSLPNFPRCAYYITLRGGPLSPPLMYTFRLPITQLHNCVRRVPKGNNQYTLRIPDFKRNWRLYSIQVAVFALKLKQLLKKRFLAIDDTVKIQELFFKENSNCHRIVCVRFPRYITTYLNRMESCFRCFIY